MNYSEKMGLVWGCLGLTIFSVGIGIKFGVAGFAILLGLTMMIFALIIAS